MIIGTGKQRVFHVDWMRIFLIDNYLRFQVSVADALRVTVLHTLHQLTEIKPSLQSRPFMVEQQGT
jgi:hypothetical protein